MQPRPEFSQHTRSRNMFKALPHVGACGERRRCWRASCRLLHGAYNTIELLSDGTLVAHCHGNPDAPAGYWAAS
jgi:hypothetical protein